MLLNYLDRLISVLQHARLRKDMYFNPVAPVSVIHYLNGLRTSLSFAGLEWSSEHREKGFERRGLDYRCAAWGIEELQAQGLSDEEVVDALLAIEIEMWQSMRDSFAVEADPPTFLVGEL